MFIRNLIILAVIVALVVLSQQGYLDAVKDWFATNVYNRISGEVAKRGEVVKKEWDGQRNNFIKKMWDSASNFIFEKLFGKNEEEKGNESQDQQNLDWTQKAPF